MQNKAKTTGFRPKAETRKRLEVASEVTDLSLTDLLELCVQYALGHVVQSKVQENEKLMKERRKHAQEFLKSRAA